MCLLRIVVGSSDYSHFSKTSGIGEDTENSSLTNWAVGPLSCEQEWKVFEPFRKNLLILGKFIMVYFIMTAYLVSFYNKLLRLVLPR